MVSVILGLVGSLLSIIDTKLKQKYIDRKIELERAYNEAINVPFEKRDNALIDTLEFEILLLAKALMFEVKK